MKASIVIKGLSIKVEGQLNIKLEEFNTNTEMGSDEMSSYLALFAGMLEGIKDIKL